MLGSKEIASVERRAAKLRMTMGELCEAAGVAASTWSRARQRGRVTIGTVRKLEEQLDLKEKAS